MEEKTGTCERSSRPNERTGLQRAFDLYEFSVAVMRQNLRRRHPEASEEEIEERLRAWKLERPGAEHGDAGGPPHFRIGTRRFDV
jgi:hypothetical protein